LKATTVVFASLLLLVSAAAAQQMQPLQAPALKIQPLQVQVAPPNPNLLPMDEVSVLKRDNARLKRENKQLQALVADLSTRVNNFTQLGGSEVRVYCSSPTVSTNTSGGSTDCAAAGGLTCESASGQCRTQCIVSDDCAGTLSCNGGVCTDKVLGNEDPDDN
jgi:hypothetical protein